MSDNTYWAYICSLAIAAFITSVIAITVGNQQSNDKVIALVQAGADPIAARCAIVGVSTDGMAVICSKALENSKK